MKSRALPIFLWALILGSAAQDARVMPTVQGDSFSGQRVILPDDTKGKVAVLVFGFTKASKDSTSAWAAKLLSDFRTHPGFELYQLPVLEDVPRLIRGMVISSIKKGVPENIRDHFVPILQNEAELKNLVNYKEPDDAYLVVLDSSGQIVQQRHGPLSEASYAQFRGDLQSLLDRQK